MEPHQALSVINSLRCHADANGVTALLVTTHEEHTCGRKRRRQRQPSQFPQLPTITIVSSESHWPQSSRDIAPHCQPSLTAPSCLPSHPRDTPVCCTGPVVDSSRSLLGPPPSWLTSTTSGHIRPAITAIMYGCAADTACKRRYTQLECAKLPVLDYLIRHRTHAG
jgi:hypothetical protein